MHLSAIMSFVAVFWCYYEFFGSIYEPYLSFRGLHALWTFCVGKFQIPSQCVTPSGFLIAPFHIIICPGAGPEHHTSDNLGHNIGAKSA